MNSKDQKRLSYFANNVRKLIVDTSQDVGSVHFGGCFSVVEILTTYLSPVILGHQSFDEFINNNMLILSKGHCGLAYYAALTECRVLSKDELKNYCLDGGRFIGHIKRDHKIGIGWSTGSLGHGLSIAMGYSSANNEIQSQKSVTCILGDGEMHEGSNWEALLHLSMRDQMRLLIVLDNNGFLSLGPTNNIRRINPMNDKLDAFNIKNLEVNGHDFIQLSKAYAEANKSNFPVFIIANTIKGKGVSFMEGQSEWHAKRADDQTLKKIKLELEK